MAIFNCYVSSPEGICWSKCIQTACFFFTYHHIPSNGLQIDHKSTSNWKNQKNGSECAPVLTAKKKQHILNLTNSSRQEGSFMATVQHRQWFNQRPNPSPLVGYHQSSIERIQLQPFPHLPGTIRNRWSWANWLIGMAFLFTWRVSMGVFDINWGWDYWWHTGSTKSCPVPIFQPSLLTPFRLRRSSFDLFQLIAIVWDSLSNGEDKKTLAKARMSALFQTSMFWWAYS